MEGVSLILDPLDKLRGGESPVRKKNTALSKMFSRF
jgi:hypothetical protein